MSYGRSSLAGVFLKQQLGKILKWWPIYINFCPFLPNIMHNQAQNTKPEIKTRNNIKPNIFELSMHKTLIDVWISWIFFTMFVLDHAFWKLNLVRRLLYFLFFVHVKVLVLFYITLAIYEMWTSLVHKLHQCGFSNIRKSSYI